MGSKALRGIETSYGSDASGLICGYAFDPETPARAIDTAAAVEWLRAARDSGDQGFIWLHCSLSNSSSVKWLGEHLPLPSQYFETLRGGGGSTRIELAGDFLIAVINDVHFDFSFDSSQIATLWLCVHRRFVVSTRLHPLRSIDRLRVSVRSGERIGSPLLLLTHLLRDQADVLQQIARDSAKRVDQIEDTLLSGLGQTKRSDLGALRRLFVRLRRLLAPEPGALFRLLNRHPAWFDQGDVQELRAATEEFSDVLVDLSSLEERTKLLQEEISSRDMEQTNRSLFLLTMVTVLALPINIIAGLLGMNVGGIPLAQDSGGFWVIAAIVAIFSLVAGWFAFLRQRD